jgi:pyrroline-5-carboxylate reductase
LRWESDPVRACDGAEVVLVAVKPFQFEGLLPGLKLPGRPLFVSLAAGLALDRIRGWLGTDARLVRAMPNTPVQVGHGVTALAAGPELPEADRRLAESLFTPSGTVFWMEEGLIDVATALSGSGPAYFYRFVSHLVSEAEALGLSRGDALAMAARTAAGAAAMLLQTGRDPEELVAQVRSKGGTTEAALQVFEAHDLEGACREAVRAAHRRARELSNA